MPKSAKNGFQWPFLRKTGFSWHNFFLDREFSVEELRAKRWSDRVSGEGCVVTKQPEANAVADQELFVSLITANYEHL